MQKRNCANFCFNEDFHHFKILTGKQILDALFKLKLKFSLCKLKYLDYLMLKSTKIFNDTHFATFIYLLFVHSY